MISKKLNTIVFSLGLILITSTASAHLNPYNITTNATGLATTNSSGNTTEYTISNSHTSNNYSWYVASDAVGGNSHTGSFLRFDVTSAGGANVGFNVTGLNATTPQGVVVPGFQFNPAFTLYSGAFPVNVHDGATYDIFNPVNGAPVNVYKEGEWLSLADFTMENEVGVSGTINYLTHAGENNTTTNAFIENYFLPQGSYTLAIGGACALCAKPLPITPDFVTNFTDLATSLNITLDEMNWLIGDRPGDSTLNNYFFDSTLSVQPVPLPAALWLFGIALFGLININKRETKHQFTSALS